MQEYMRILGGLKYSCIGRNSGTSGVLVTGSAAYLRNRDAVGDSIRPVTDHQTASPGGGAWALHGVVSADPCPDALRPRGEIGTPDRTAPCPLAERAAPCPLAERAAPCPLAERAAPCLGGAPLLGGARRRACRARRRQRSPRFAPPLRSAKLSTDG